MAGRTCSKHKGEGPSTLWKCLVHKSYELDFNISFSRGHIHPIMCHYSLLLVSVPADVCKLACVPRSRACFIPRYVGPRMDMVKLDSLEDMLALPLTSWNIRQPAGTFQNPVCHSWWLFLPHSFPPSPFLLFNMIFFQFSPPIFYLHPLFSSPSLSFLFFCSP